MISVSVLQNYFLLPVTYPLRAEFKELALDVINETQFTSVFSFINSLLAFFKTSSE